MGERRVVLLVTGSRALEDELASYGAAVEVITAALAGLDAFRPRACLVTGDAMGPDAWAAARAVARGLRVHVYGLDGTVREQSKIGRVHHRWREGAPPTDADARRRWPLVRNEVMVGAVATARDLGWEVRVVALHAPWSKTRGTAHTVTAARLKGLDVTEWTCPAELGPGR